MIRLQPVLLAALGLSVTSQTWAADICKHSYEKVFPYDLPLGNPQAYINVHNEVRLSYNCQSGLAQATSGVQAGVFDLDLDLLQAEAKATARQGQAATAGAKVLVLGFEVAREDLDLDQVLNVSISPEPEVDVSGTLSFNVGPIPVPVKYGVTANAQMNIRAGTKGFGVTLNLVPAAAAQVYVQAGLDIMVAEAVARGDINLIDEVLDNEIAVLFEDSDRRYMRFDVTSKSRLQALDGYVFIRASAGVGPLKKNYEKDLLRWDGFSRDDLVLDFSDRVVILQ